MKRLFLTSILLIFALPIALRALQETPAPSLEITGVNATQLPTVTVTANVYDTLGQPVRGLTAENFSIFGELENNAQIVSVENISDDALPFATVLVIDVSDSMEGAPFEQAKEAARTFVNSVADIDSVALAVFSSGFRIVQDFTSDKTVLLNAIDSLRLGGQTALYQGAYDGSELGGNSPVPRRAMILLSDGAEYGGFSDVTAEEAIEHARARGVPSYTIGLGYGADRSFLQQLSDSTNARFFESPTPEQLVEIYSGLADLLRSQYVITLTADLPLDGTEYDLGLEVTSGDASATATAVLRAPIPVPIVGLPTLPSTPIETPTDITANVSADDQLVGVTFTVGDETVTLTDEPFTFTLDPAAYAPGDYSLTVSAEDANGDVGSAEVAFTIATLPSEVTTSPDLASLGTISEPIDVTLIVSGQTPLASAEYSLQGPAFADDVLLPVDADNTITIYPQFLTPGDNLLTVQVTNEGGVTSTQVFPLTIASLPPTVSVNGVQEGQIIDAPITFEIAASGQTPTVEVTISVDDMVLEPADDGSYTLDPMTLEPGAHTVTITATDENNQTITTEVGVIISPLPPTIVATGLNDGDEVTEDTLISLEFVSQTPIVAVTVQLDGEELAQLESEPFDITLQPLEIAPGEHTLTIIAENASSQQSTLDIDFIVAEGPSLTATALAPTPTGAATQTPDDRATRTEQAAALAGVRTATAEAVNEQATETGEANSAATRTERAGATETSQANAVATRTAIAQATQNMQMTASQEGRASATSDARATSQAVAQQEALNSTREALATANVQARVNATETADARATRLSQSNATATQLVLLLASETAVGEVTATRSALETQVAISQATVDTQATRDAETEEANATQSGLATRNAQATERSNETATAVQQATDDTRMTAVGSTAVPTEETEITSVAQAAETSTARPSPTPQPTMTLVEAENPPATSDIAPIAILAIFLLIALVVAYLLYPRLKRPK